MKKFIFSLMVLLTTLQLDATKAPNRPILSATEKANIRIAKMKRGETIIFKFLVFIHKRLFRNKSQKLIKYSEKNTPPNAII